MTGKERKIIQITLEKVNLEEWRKDQMQDSNITIFVKGKEKGR